MEASSEEGISSGRLVESTDSIFRGIQKVSLLDYPGKIAAVIFVGGCNFRCPFCYNRDLVLNPENSESLEEGEILRYLRERRDWLDGVVVTGGEPTVHAGLTDFLEKVKALGFSVKLDTNGSNPERLAELLDRGLVDYVALDVKAPLIEEKYQAVAGTPGRGVAEEVEASIALLLSNGIDYEFRTTVVPNLLSAGDILLIAERIKEAKRYYLQHFKPARSHIDQSYSNLAPYPLEFLRGIQRQVAQHFEVCGIRGTR